MSTEKFISDFCHWGYNGGLPDRQAKKLSTQLHKIINQELPLRDDLVHVLIRDFTNSSNITCSFKMNNIWCKSIENKHLLVGVTMPFWRTGFHDIIKDEYLYDAISWFFHYSSQYVGRSRMVDIIGAIALTYNRACDFRGHNLRESHCINNFHAISYELEAEIGQLTANVGGKGRELIAWFNLLNSLDPFINRIIFNYVRAVDLYDKNFTEEAVTALYSVITVGEQFIRERFTISGYKKHETMVKILNLSKKHNDNIEQLYHMRCFFGAHPSMTKWWDFSEIYDGIFEELFMSVEIIIFRIALEEQKNRIVEKHPDKWSSWFNKNAMLLWNSVGFGFLK